MTPTSIDQQITAIEQDAAQRVAALKRLQAQTDAQAAALAQTDAQRAEQEAAALAQEADRQELDRQLPELLGACAPYIAAAMAWQKKVQQVAGILGALADEQAAIYQDLVGACDTIGAFYAAHRAAYPDQEQLRQALGDAVKNFLQADEWLAASDLSPVVRREYRIRPLNLLADCHAAAQKALGRGAR